MAGLEDDLSPRESQAGDARGGVCLVPAPVPGLLGRRAMVSEAVRLDHEGEIGPVEVDLEASHVLPGLGSREPCSERDRQEAPLEVGVGERERTAVEHLTQVRHAVPSAKPFDS